MKLAMLYTAWTGDDMDMLKRSIDHHLPNVDGIFVFHQFTSNYGEHSLMKQDDFNPNARYIHYEPPFLDIDPKETERQKHNFMIQHAKNEGFTHFILSACDHFYNRDSFDYAKKAMESGEIDVCFTKMITYYKEENWALWPLEDYYMPFIHKMYPNTEIAWRSSRYPVYVDPSVKVNTCFKHLVLAPNDAILHHFSMVRKNIYKKFRNAASSIRWSSSQVETFISEYQKAKPGDKITYFQGREITEHQNILKLLKKDV